MVVQYPRTVWKNSYAEHEVTGETYNLRKKENKLLFNLQILDAFLGFVKISLRFYSDLDPVRTSSDSDTSWLMIPSGE